MIQYPKEGGVKYFDINGTEIVRGSIIRYPDGRDREVFETEKGELGIDATNPVWVESGKAVPCEFGVYPLTEEDCEVVEVVIP